MHAPPRLPVLVRPLEEAQQVVRQGVQQLGVPVGLQPDAAAAASGGDGRAPGAAEHVLLEHLVGLLVARGVSGVVVLHAVVMAVVVVVATPAAEQRLGVGVLGARLRGGQGGGRGGGGQQ